MLPPDITFNIEEQIIGARNSHIEKIGDVNSDNVFCFNLLKNRLSELERQIIEKDATINFLSNQLINIGVNGDSRVNKAVNDHNNSFQERVDNSVNNNLLLIHYNNSNNKKEKSQNVIIIGDSMSNNINSRWLSKSKKVSVSNFPGATSEDILAEVEDTLKTHPDTLIVHAGTNDLTKNINTLRSVKKLCEKAKRISPDKKIVFSNIIYRKDRRNTDKQCIDTNARPKNFCNQKNIPLIDNGNIKEEHLGVKKLHLNRRGNSLFAKNLLGFIEQNWNFKFKGHESIFLKDVANVSHSDAQQVLKDIRKSNINKFDMRSELIKGFFDVFMTSEIKLHDSFPEGQFFIEGYHTPFRYDRNGNGGGIFLYVRKEIPAKVIHCHFPTSESFFVEINLHKKKWFLWFFLGDFNAEIEETTIKSFIESYNLTNLIKRPTCFKTPEKPSCINLILTNRPKSLQTT